jgi:threonine/homoserine/homoserine lactone efflux protein
LCLSQGNCPVGHLPGMLTYLSAGIVLGLSAGFSPGPLMTLVISQTIRHGFREGAKVATAPLVTDLPVILAALFILSKSAGFHHFLGFISLIGGLFVLFLAWEGFRSATIEVSPSDLDPQSLGKGVAVNLLSPYPYLFWLTVGGPIIIKGWGDGGLRSAVVFLAGFYVCLVGAKLAIAVATGKSRQFLHGGTYRVIMRLLGALLVLFAALLIRDGLTMAGLI